MKWHGNHPPQRTHDQASAIPLLFEVMQRHASSLLAPSGVPWLVQLSVSRGARGASEIDVDANVHARVATISHLITHIITTSISLMPIVPVSVTIIGTSPNLAADTSMGTASSRISGSAMGI